LGINGCLKEVEIKRLEWLGNDKRTDINRRTLELQMKDIKFKRRLR
jgi:hypothetical protein